ncbi:protein yellow-like [Schistocerca nitens]|uniref:protein yellow-like n=1 Tax=Schistocerca nitens TaxID=7011 RepID=UPI0021192843|nr:protein yellow-like [Schistocerca nitens]
MLRHATSTAAAVALMFFWIFAVSDGTETGKLVERFAWRQLDFAYPDAQSRQNALRTGDFIPENNLPVGIEVWGDKLFVTVPRWRQGIPATLNYIPLSTASPDSPQLIPYPDWETNREGNCNGLTTVYRIKADACDRLWVLDVGTVGYDNTTENVCPYSINVYDLHTNRRLRRYQLRPDDTNSDTFIANIAVDIGASCDDTFMYASDELGYGLVIYSWEQNTSWRVTHPFFLPDPLRGDFNIAGMNFQWWSEGVFGMALTPPQEDGFRVLLFHPLASHREFAVSTRVLRDRSLVDSNFHYFQNLGERGPNGHVTAQYMGDDGILFFNLIDQNAIGCWDGRKHYRPHNMAIVDKDDEALVFPSDVKVDRAGNLWVMSDRMPVFLLAELDYSDVNFRIFSGPVSTAIAGTPCDPSVGEFSGPPLVSRFQEDGAARFTQDPYQRQLFGTFDQPLPSYGKWTLPLSSSRSPYVAPSPRVQHPRFGAPTAVGHFTL